MIKITYKQASSMSFIQAMQQLTQMDLPIKASYSLKKIVEAIQGKYSEMHAQFTTLSEGFPNRATNEEDMKAFQKKEDELGETVMEIQQNPITLSALDGVKISASALDALSPVLTDASVTELKVVDTGNQAG